MQSLKTEIERLYALGAEAKQDKRAMETFLEFRDALTRGEIRSAEKRDGRWQANAWVKQGILLGFRLGEMAQMDDGGTLSFVDKDTFPARRFSVLMGGRRQAVGSGADVGGPSAGSG